MIPFNEDPEDRDYLIRIPRLKDSTPSWEDSIVTVDPPPTQLLPFSVDDTTLGKLKDFPRSGALEVELFALPARVGRSHERPRLIYALLAVDSASDFIVGVELMEAVDGVDLMYASAAETLASDWMQHQIVPQEIRAGSARLLNLLEPLASELDVTLSYIFENHRIVNGKCAPGPLLPSLRSSRANALHHDHLPMTTHVGNHCYTANIK